MISVKSVILMHDGILYPFDLGDYVHKKSGSYWEGKVVGFYSTEQTPEGYCVQLLGKDDGPVQIYPRAALVLGKYGETK